MMHGVAVILAGVGHSLAGVSFAALAIAVALHVGKLSAEARSWHWIVRYAHDSSDVRFRTTWAAFASSIGANAVLPARVGEALRVGVVRRHVPGSSVVTVVATIVLETVIELAFAAAVIIAVVLGGQSLGSNGRAPALLGLPRTQWPSVPSRASSLRAWRPGSCSGRVRGYFSAAWRRGSRSCARLGRSSAGFSRGSWSPGRCASAACMRFSSPSTFPRRPGACSSSSRPRTSPASVPLLPGNAGTQQAAIGVALAGSASVAGVLGFGVGMQAATAITDLVLGAAALFLVADRRDVTAALAMLRPRHRLRPAGGRA